MSFVKSISDFKEEIIDIVSLHDDYIVECSDIAHRLESEITHAFLEVDGWIVFMHGKYIEISKDSWQGYKGNIFIELEFDRNFNNLAYDKVNVTYSAHAVRYIDKSRHVVCYDFSQKEQAIQDIVYNLEDMVDSYANKITTIIQRREQ